MTYVAGNDIACSMYNGHSWGLRADDRLPGNNYHTSPPGHLEIACGVRQLLPMQLLHVGESNRLPDQVEIVELTLPPIHCTTEIVNIVNTAMCRKVLSHLRHST